MTPHDKLCAFYALSLRVPTEDVPPLEYDMLEDAGPTTMGRILSYSSVQR